MWELLVAGGRCGRVVPRRSFHSGEQGACSRQASHSWWLLFLDPQYMAWNRAVRLVTCSSHCNPSMLPGVLVTPATLPQGLCAVHGHGCVGSGTRGVRLDILQAHVGT